MSSVSIERDTISINNIVNVINTVNSTVDTITDVQFYWYDTSAIQRNATPIDITFKKVGQQIYVETTEVISFASGALGEGVTSIITSFGVVPDKYRPATTVNTVIYGREGGSKVPMLLSISSLGSISISTLQAGANFPTRTLADEPTVFTFSATYIKA